MKTALKITERIKKEKLDARVVCVLGSPLWDCEIRGRKWPYIHGDIWKKLEDLGVVVVEHYVPRETSQFQPHPIAVQIPVRWNTARHV